MIKTEDGWKVDKPALLAYLITLVVGGCLTFVGSYYGWQYTQKDHENRIGKMETLSAEHSRRITENEKYIAVDAKDTEWFKVTFQEIKTSLKDIRQDQKKRSKGGE
jgi:hypothetical protein